MLTIEHQIVKDDEYKSYEVPSRLGRKLESLDSLFPIQKRYDLGDYVHWKGNAGVPMHRWLRY